MTKNIWFTADLHLNHKNILKLSNRPFGTIEAHDEAIIENYNKLVDTQDDVYILGDIAFQQSYNNYVRIFQRLKGNKYIIVGNHDNKQALIRCQQDGLVVSVRDTQILNIGDDSIHLNHLPLLEWQGFHKNYVHLHGHTHGNLDDYCKSTDVGVDCWEYAPVSWSELKEYLDNQCYPNIHPDRFLY